MIKSAVLFILSALLLFIFTSCAAFDSGDPDGSANMSGNMIDVIISSGENQAGGSGDTDTYYDAGSADTDDAADDKYDTEEIMGVNTEGVVSINEIDIAVGSTVLTAELADNSSAMEFAKLLEKGPVTVHMHDYGSFEKVGSLPESIVRNDERITTEPGDIILYQGNQITIYYDTNTWSFTRLGKLNDITQAELKEILGEGDVTVTFRLK